MRAFAIPPILLGAVLSITAVPARGDVIRLREGGEIRGQLEESVSPPVEDGSQNLVIITLAGTRIEIEPRAAAFVSRRSPVVEEYITRSRRVEHTVEAHWKLAEWCRSHLLSDERDEQLELLLDVDPDHAESRRILGYIQHNGEWVTREELMTSRGYVRYKGKWITRQELNLIEKDQAQREAEIAWYPKVRLWSRWLTGTDPRRRSQAVEELRRIDSADAIAALKNFLAAEPQEQVRKLYVEVVGRIGGEQAVAPLLAMYLYDGSSEIRGAALDRIGEDQFETAVPILTSGLKHDQNKIVRRAASALGKIGDPAAVPALIDALVTSHRYKVEVPSSSAMTFGQTAGGQIGLMNPNLLSNSLPPDIALLARTGQLPYGVVVLPPAGQVRVPKYVTVRADIQNSEVLAALRTITGKNLGYNEHDWQLWWSLNKS